MSKIRVILGLAVVLALVSGCGTVEQILIASPEPIPVLPVHTGTEYVTELSKKDLPAGGIVLVSWNACNFGKKKSQEVIAKMAQILRVADIVALQEISTSEFGVQAVAKLCDELNRTGAKWDYVVSDATHESPYLHTWLHPRLQIAHRGLCSTA